MTNPSEVSPLCALLTTLAQPSGLKLNLADARLPPSQSSAPETAVGPRASLDHLSHGQNRGLQGPRCWERPPPTKGSTCHPGVDHDTVVLFYIQHTTLGGCEGSGTNDKLKREGMMAFGIISTSGTIRHQRASQAPRIRPRPPGRGSTDDTLVANLTGPCWARPQRNKPSVPRIWPTTRGKGELII